MRFFLGLLMCLLLPHGRLWAQPSKGSFVINPQALVSEWKFKSDSIFSRQYVNLGTSVHYYLTDKLAVGIWLLGEYSNRSLRTATPGYYTSRTYMINLSPEISYTFMATRFSPFLRIRYGSIGYIHMFSDNPGLPTRAREKGVGNFLTNYSSASSLSASLGLAYSIKKRLALTGQINVVPFNYDGTFNTSLLRYASVGLGAQFVLGGH
ncbi:hypothetical protein ACFSUS_16940 [Spirosoma soli]|uniref:Outer membrane protein beta-barrel domain-containing protein n=1 Tax=Spirosoma soli TaxID=1770529 RepID=A0ABW5M5Q4_9BACT